MKSWIYRTANTLATQRPRRHNGFYRKLKANPAELEILGDGRQAKSYLEVHECVAAMLFALRARETVNIFNIGSEDWIDVKSIAEIVAEEMHLPEVKFRFTCGERGWVGDVPKMQLSIERIKQALEPELGSRESVRLAVRDLLKS